MGGKDILLLVVFCWSLAGATSSETVHFEKKFAFRSCSHAHMQLMLYSAMLLTQISRDLRCQTLIWHAWRIPKFHRLVESSVTPL